MSTPLVKISQHTTSSAPRPHVLYTVESVLDGKEYVVQRRYSEFIALNTELQVPSTTTIPSLPPKRIISTTFVPSAWIDDTLIAERKAGLSAYLNALLASKEYGSHRDNTSINQVLKEFLTVPKLAGRDGRDGNLNLELEDALPSTLSRKAALRVLEGGEGEADADPDVGTAATMIAASYYPDWSADSFPPENLDYSKWDILFFAFATPNSSSQLAWDSGSQAILTRLVTSAKNSGKGTKVVLSVGGWGGSFWFSQACSTAANRTTFVNSMTSAVNTFALDGVDIDWEYPNSEGAGNPHSSSDAANLLSLLKSLRTALGTSKIISSAVPHLPWIGSNGSPLTDVSAYAAQMTYVNIMNYDVWGASSTPGPNAPLGDLCGTSSQPKASAQAAFKQWTAAGFPASKLLLGLPLYGYVSESTKTGLTGSFAPSANMLLLEKEESSSDTPSPFLNGAHPRTKKSVPVTPENGGDVTIAANLQSWYGQQIPFSSIVSSGALVKKSDGNYGEGGGFTMGWDDCSDTPFLFNTSQRTVVTYDDTWSLGDKAAYAKSVGMAGCFTWSLDQDHGVTLQNVIRSKLGK